MVPPLREVTRRWARCSRELSLAQKLLQGSDRVSGDKGLPDQDHVSTGLTVAVHVGDLEHGRLRDLDCALWDSVYHPAEKFSVEFKSIEVARIHAEKLRPQ